MPVRKRLGPKGRVNQGILQNKPGGKYIRTDFRTLPFPGFPPPPVDGTEQPVPGRTTLDALHSLSSAGMPLLSRATPTGSGGGEEGRCPTGDTKIASIFKVPDKILITTTKRH